MARNSLAAAKVELYAALQTVPDVVAVFDYDPPPAELVMSTMLSVGSAGIGPSVFRFTVRLYVQVAGSARIAQDDMDRILMDVDAAIPGTFGESEWRIRYLEEIDMLRAESVLECVREDV